VAGIDWKPMLRAHGKWTLRGKEIVG
jgi:hypothetical protein